MSGSNDSGLYRYNLYSIDDLIEAITEGDWTVGQRDKMRVRARQGVMERSLADVIMLSSVLNLSRKNVAETLGIQKLSLERYALGISSQKFSKDKRDLFVYRTIGAPADTLFETFINSTKRKE